tara:strand:- start:2189 stop:3130 length:942 start_codon:yes stop_codon:yes gene_type:complete
MYRPHEKFWMYRESLLVSKHECRLQTEPGRFFFFILKIKKNNMLTFFTIQALSAFAGPIRTDSRRLVHGGYHQDNVKYVPLNEFKKPLRFLPEDLTTIKRISLQPTLPANYDHNADNLIGDQPLHLQGRKTIVLDLDETLFTVDHVGCWDGDAGYLTRTGPSALRPFHKPFIQACKDRFEVVVWTRSENPYAKKKCEWLGLDGLPMITGWKDCDTNGAKPLYKLHRVSSQILLIDDDKVHLSANPRSQLLIPPWNGDENDCELESLIPIINQIAKEPSVQDSLDICLAQSYIYEKGDLPHDCMTEIEPMWLYA